MSNFLDNLVKRWSQMMQRNLGHHHANNDQTDDEAFKKSLKAENIPGTAHHSEKVQEDEDKPFLE